MGSASCLGSLPLVLQEMELRLQLLLFSLQTQTVLCPLGLSYAQTHRPHAVGQSQPWLLLVRISTLPLLSGVTSFRTAFPSSPPLIPLFLPQLSLPKREGKPRALMESSSSTY